MSNVAKQVVDLLVARGFEENMGCWRKLMPTGGAFGRAYVFVQFGDETGRWLERVDGWGKVIRDVDLRNYADDPAGALAAVLVGG